MIFLVVFFSPTFALDAREKATGIPYKSTEASTYREIAGNVVTVGFLNGKVLLYTCWVQDREISSTLQVTCNSCIHDMYILWHI